MKKLNLNATKIFCRLLQKLDAESYIKIHADGFMPLTIERLEGQVQTPYGYATLYSLSHTYRQNGGTMRDPEMVFIVLDRRLTAYDLPMLAIYPQLYQQDNMGICEESVTLNNGAVTQYKPLWQRDHCLFANQWLQNIKEQGFLQ